MVDSQLEVRALPVCWLTSICWRTLSILKLRRSGCVTFEREARPNQRVEVVEDVGRAGARAVPGHAVVRAGRQHLIHPELRGEARVADLRGAAGE